MSALSLDLTLDRGSFTLALALDLPATGITAISGPSGSGKTTLLRLIAGLETAARGHIRYQGQDWQDSARRHFLPPHRRPIGYVFQEPRLFPHLTVRQNIDFARRRALDPAARRADLTPLLQLLGIGHLLDRAPHTLSGGEQSRAAIARALAGAPRLLLMDEPLAALDAARKAEILPWLERLCAHARIPILYVTHAHDEIARLADHILLLDQGRPLAHGSAQDLLARLDLPAARAPDAGVFLTATVTGHDRQDHLTRFRFCGGELLLPLQDLPLGAERRIRIAARDVSLALARHDTTSITNLLPATITDLSEADTPAHLLVRLDAGGAPLLAHLTRRAVRTLHLRPGLALWAQIKAVALVD